MGKVFSYIGLVLFMLGVLSFLANTSGVALMSFGAVFSIIGIVLWLVVDED